MAWWVHKIVRPASLALYRINHARDSTDADEKSVSPDNPYGHADMEAAEAGLSGMALENGQKWFIHRTGNHSASTRCYTIDHEESNTGYSKTCPPSAPGYSSIGSLCDELRLSKFDETGNCYDPVDEAFSEATAYSAARRKTSKKK